VDDLRPWLRLTAAHLREAGANFAVVGGLAVSVRVEPRFTRDIDLAIAAANDSEAERILGVLIRYRYRPVAELDRSDRDRLATMRLAPPGASEETLDVSVPVVDLLFSSCGVEPEVVRDSKPFRFGAGLTLPVAQVSGLIAMKLVSASRKRRKDQVDLQALVESATQADLARARELIELVAERGYHRGRDLSAMLDEYVRDSGSEI
jgi:predicted nucleotidyltransferase